MELHYIWEIDSLTMNNPLNFEYEVFKHYYHKGIFARAGIVTHLIAHLRENLQKENRVTEHQEVGLNDDEVVVVWQLAIIAHIMMFIEDLAVICQSIKDGKIEYYNFLDRSGDEDLGVFIRKFYGEIQNASDQDLSKILSFTDVDSFEFVKDDEKEIVLKIIKQMLEKTRTFFNKIILFRENHIKIFRRYKHAGFPIFLAQPFPTPHDLYKNFEFVSLGLTSRGTLGKELTAIPYSSKAIDSYENLEKDIFAFFGTLITYKFICYERNVSGLIPNSKSLFGIKLPASEIAILDEIWKRFESKHPLESRNKTQIGLESMTEFLHWYVDLEENAKRVLNSE